MTLPEGWKLRLLGDVSTTALGKMLDRGNRRGLTEVRYLRNVNVQWDRITTGDLLTMELADSERERFAVEPGDLLVCEGGEIGRAAIWRGDGDFIAYQKALHRVRPSSAVTSRFLLHLFRHLSRSGQLLAHSTGTTIAHLPQQHLRRLPIPVPPIEEQRQIVDILEDHLSRLDAANNGLTVARRRLDAYRQSALDQLTQRGPVKILPLGDVLSRIEAGRSFGGAARPSRDDEWGIVRVSAMTWGEFRPEENKVITGAADVDLRHQIHAGDLLMSRANTSEYVGAPVLVRSEPPRLLLSDKSLRLVPRADTSAEYLWRVLSAPRARVQISARASGNQDSMRNISQSTLKMIMIPWTDHQQSVIETANQLDADHERVAAALERGRSRTATLRRALLQAAFSGQLTGRRSDFDQIEEAVG